MKPDTKVAGLNYTATMEAALRDIVEHTAIFPHVRLPEVAVTVTQVRNSVRHGVYAALVPLRFEKGASVIEYHGRRYAMPKLVIDGRTMLYVMTFYLPRFQNLSYHEKLKTMFHELYHINPEFNGDLRRFSGHNYAHGASRKAYDRLFQPDLQRYLEQRGDAALLAFLKPSFTELRERHGEVFGRVVKRLRPQPVDGA